MKWWEWMLWSLFFECWVLSQPFSLSSFTSIKRLFSFSLLSAIRVVSSVYISPGNLDSSLCFIQPGILHEDRSPQIISCLCGDFVVWVLKSGGFPHSSNGKESACNAGDPGSIPGLGRSAAEGIGYPLQYSWAALVAQLVKNCLQCGRPGFVPWVGKISWRRQRLPTPVFRPGELHGVYSHKELDTTVMLSFSRFFHHMLN